MIHSIRRHHFFGGPKTPLRVDPKQLVEFFDVEPGRSYSPNRADLSVWIPVAHTPSIYGDYHTAGITKKYGNKTLHPDGLIVYAWVQQAVIFSEKHVKLEKPLVIHDVLVDLEGNEVQAGQTILRHTLLPFDIG